MIRRLGLALLLGPLGAAALGAASAGAALPSSLQLTAPREPGTPLVVHGVVQGKDGKPVAGAAIHVYQTDDRGWYTPEKPMDEPHARLSGHLRTDAAGRFELHTIRPGRYPWTANLGGKERRIPAHIHLDITAPGHAEQRLQLVFADDPVLAEAYWKDWVKRHGQPVLEARPAGHGLAGAVTVTID